MEKDWAAERARAEAIEGRVAALEAAVAMLTQGLFERGDITINDVRATLGLPPFRGLWADSPGYVQAKPSSPPPLTPDFKLDFSKLGMCGDIIKDGCEHVMTGGCPFACFRGPCMFEKDAGNSP